MKLLKRLYKRWSPTTRIFFWLAVFGLVAAFVFWRFPYVWTYHSQQSIIARVPTHLGGIVALNLDNMGILLYRDGNEQEITLALNDPPITLWQHEEIGGLEISDFNLWPSKTGKNIEKYTFDVGSGEVQHKITIENRIFLITLKGVKFVDFPQTPNALEYSFDISEVN